MPHVRSTVTAAHIADQSAAVSAKSRWTATGRLHHSNGRQMAV